MASDRQLKANRRNAALGGPKTDAGRAAVRLNALKHGLSAATIILPGEDAEGLKQLRTDLFEEYLPASPTELLLFEEFVRCSWRLLRMRRVETEMWTGHIIGIRTRKAAESDLTQQEADRAVAATLAETSPSYFVNYFRYERMTTRDFYRALDKLEAVQRARRRAQPLPAAKPAVAQVPGGAPDAASPAQASQPAAESRVKPHASRRPAPVSETGIRTVLQQPVPSCEPPADRAA